MLPTIEDAERWVAQATVATREEARTALWRRTISLVNAASPDRTPQGQAAYAKDWLRAACRLLKAGGQRIILTDYPLKSSSWSELGMYLTASACLGEVAVACGELLKWCDAHGVPLVEAMK